MLTRRPFRFAVLRTERNLDAWEVTSIAHLVALGGRPSVVIAPAATTPLGPIARLVEALARGRRRASTTGPGPTFEARFDLSSGRSLQDLQAQEFAFILALEPIGTFLQNLGDLATVADQGVWTHAFAIDGEDAALPPGFDAVVTGGALAAITLVRLTPSGSGQPLEQEWLRVEPHSYSRTRAALTTAGAELAARHVRRDAMPASPTRTLRLPVDGHRGELSAAHLLAILVVHAATHAVRRLLFSQDWSLGIIGRPIADVLAGVGPREIEWLPSQGGHSFLADPFGIPMPDGSCLVLAEEYVRASARGRIIATTIRGASFVSPPRPILDLDVHLSYPFVLPEKEGSWAFAPESSGLNEVAIYRTDLGGGTAERVGASLTDFPAVDPTIVEFEGKWWLFATDGARNEDGHLHVWYGDGPRGPWSPHRLNPVKCDVRSARPGGTPFVVDGVLYRPAQDDSRAYGGALVVNRLDRLTPEAFAETTVARLAPDESGPFPAGIHTLSAVGSSMLVDGKRYRFEPLTKLRRLARLRRPRRSQRTDLPNSDGGADGPP